MSGLQRLILSFEENPQNKVYQSIKHPKLFLTSLYELHELIGNESIKDSIALQIVHLLSTRDVVKDINASSVMLNTLLYGPPGTGKTLIATKLAKIWYAMGFIKQPDKSLDYFEFFSDGDNSYLTGFFYIFAGIIILIGYTVGIMKHIYSDLGRYFWHVVIFAILIAMVVIGLAMFFSRQKSSYIKEGSVKDSDLITVVSREDFVSKYLGGSDKQTKELLDANRGKVLMIDEAYSLANDHHDPYGLEVINTLNRYMSEHAGEIIIIMAGYKNLIENGIFKLQPGLPSRFTFTHECNGYNAVELCDIFRNFVKKDGWTICADDIDDIYRLFAQHEKRFISHARDVHRLMLYTQMEYSRTLLDHDIPYLELTAPMVVEAFNVLTKNTLKTEHAKTSFEPLQDMFRSMMQNNNLPKDVVEVD